MANIAHSDTPLYTVTAHYGCVSTKPFNQTKNSTENRNLSGTRIKIQNNNNKYHVICLWRHYYDSDC